MGRGRKWSSQDDEALAHAYAAITAKKYTRGPTFWEALCSHMEPARSTRALKNRWALISHEISVFVGCVARVAARKRGDGEDGETKANGNMDDLCNDRALVDEAMALFSESTGATFPFLSCWELVRHCTKFRMESKPGTQKRDHDACDASDVVEAGQEAPSGQQRQREPSNIRASVPATAASASSGGYPGVFGSLETATVVKRPRWSVTEAGNTVSAEPEVPMAPTQVLQQLLAEEMKRKNDLQEDEVALKLFSAAPESDESRRFFALLKRKKLLLLERQVDQLEQQSRR